MSPFRLNRRAVLRGAGSIAIALPWLEAMAGERRAAAQSASGMAKRFVTIYQPGGTVRNKYTPTGTETDFKLSPILSPLEPVKSKILVVDGLDMQCADQNKLMVEQHQGGITGMLTGAVQPGSGNYPKSPSIDQVLAAKLSAGKARNSIELAVRWATGKSHGLIHPINAFNFEAKSPFSPIPPRIDPQQIFTDLFGRLMPGGSTGTDDSAALALQRKKSILDFVDRRYVALAAKLGSEDRIKLESHLEKIRVIEKSLDTLPPAMTSSCVVPTKVDTSDYNPKSGLSADNDGKVRDTETDAAIPKVGKFMMDMIVMALACDITGVATLQWSDTEAKHTFPWLNLSEHHHYYQHDGGFKPVECEKICTWYSEQHAYLLQQMQAVDMGGHTLLDESVVFVGSELQDPPGHGKSNMPFLLAGGAGMRTGRWLKYGGLPHNRLLVSLLNLFGDTRTSFGDSRFADGALPSTLSLT
jgi:Protein of unknown function (DUF1552)